MEDNEKKLDMPDFSDSEFLSFLYSERDRENSQRQYQGWTLWALAGALVTVVCAGYHVVKSCILLYASQVVYFISGIMAVALYLRPILLLFEKEQVVDYKKVKTLKDVAPYYYLVLVLVVSIALSIFIPLYNKNNPWNVVSVSWMVIVLINVFGLAYDIVHREKIMKPDLNGMIFTERNWDRRYNGLLCGMLFLAGLESFKRINYPFVGSCEFELAIYISVTVFLLFFLIKVYFIERKANKIDVLIDEYLYKGLSKEVTYRMLRINRMGNTILESCTKEMLELNNVFEVYEQKKQRIVDVCNLFEQGNVETDKLHDYYDEINEVLDFLMKCIQLVEELGDKLEQIEKQAPWLITDKEYKDMISVMSYHIEKGKELVKFAKSTKNNMSKWIEKYYCQRYGCICGVDCAKRNENGSLWFRFSIWRKRKARKIKEKCKSLK